MKNDDLFELVIELAEALDSAIVELTQIAEMEVPLRDDVVAAVEERMALAATLKRVVPENEREAAKAIYREELAKATCPYDGGKMPLMPEVVQRFEEVGESLRRRAAIEPELRRALRGAVYRSDFAGC